MEDILDTVRDAVDGQIDFVGQRRSGDYSTLLLIITGFIAFNYGWVNEDITKTVWIGLAGTVVTFIICVPSWPFFNTSPVKWLPAGSAFDTS